jgi:hypothetical protein
LHLWNEHLAALSLHNRGLGGATALRRRMAASLAEVADHLESDPSLHGVAALRARTAFVSRRRVRKLLRIAQAFGFDTAVSARPDPLPEQLGAFWQNFLIWALAWTFNPATLRRNGFLRQHCDLWISRTAIRARYGRNAADRRIAAAAPAARA